MEVVFGMYNWFGLLVGYFGLCIGLIMVVGLCFRIMVMGKGVYVV